MQTWREFLNDRKAEYFSSLIGSYPCITEAAKMAGIKRQSLHRTLKRCNLKSPRPAHRGNWGD
jgi:predicted DNA-binding protein YlxM (UPF0122 family)